MVMAAPPTPAVVAKKKQAELVKVKQEKQLEIKQEQLAAKQEKLAAKRARKEARRVARRPSGSASCTRLRVGTAFFCSCSCAARPTGSTVSFDVVDVPQSKPIPSSFAIRAGEILLRPWPFFACLCVPHHLPSAPSLCFGHRPCSSRNRRTASKFSSHGVLVAPQSNPIPSSFAICAVEILVPAPLPLFACLCV